MNRCFFWTRRRWIGVRARQDGAEELEGADVHALPSAESYPEARGGDFPPEPIHSENLLGTTLRFGGNNQEIQREMRNNQAGPERQGFH